VPARHRQSVVGTPRVGHNQRVSFATLVVPAGLGAVSALPAPAASPKGAQNTPRADKRLAGRPPPRGGEQRALRAKRRRARRRAGLVAVVLLMGYGLVAIPRGAWREANPEARLRFAFHRRARTATAHPRPMPALCAPPGLRVACPART